MKDTYEGLLTRMKETYRSETGELPDDASDVGVRFRVLAGELYSILAEFDWMKRQMDPMAAEGKELEKHAADRGLSRRPGAKAGGSLQFGRSTLLWFPIRIPKGTACLTEDGTVFETTVEGQLNVESLTAAVPAAARADGSAGNAAKGTVRRFFQPVPGIETVTNPAAFAGGSDPETDESLRKRLKKTWEEVSNGSNLAFYQKQAKAHAGVADALAVANDGGTGTVGVYLACNPDGQAQRIVEEVQADMDEKREINVVVKVHPAQVKELAVMASLFVKPGVTVASAETGCLNALKALFAGLSIGEALTAGKVSAAMMNTGTLTDCAVYFQGSSAPEKNQLLRAGTLSVTGVMAS